MRHSAMWRVCHKNHISFASRYRAFGIIPFLEICTLNCKFPSVDGPVVKDRNGLAAVDERFYVWDKGLAACHNCVADILPTVGSIIRILSSLRPEQKI
jgi:hypothetical protein